MKDFMKEAFEFMIAGAFFLFMLFFLLAGIMIIIKALGFFAELVF